MGIPPSPDETSVGCELRPNWVGTTGTVLIASIATWPTTDNCLMTKRVLAVYQGRREFLKGRVAMGGAVGGVVLLGARMDGIPELLANVNSVGIVIASLAWRTVRVVELSKGLPGISYPAQELFEGTHGRR